MAQKVDYAALKKGRIYETETERLRFPETGSGRWKPDCREY